MILGARRLGAREALQWGLADALQPPGHGTPPPFLAAPVKRPKKGLPLRNWRQRLLESNPLGRWLIYRGAARLIRRRVPDDMPAPFEALQAVRVGLRQGLAAGLAYEREASGRLAMTPACRNLITLFFQREQARKLPESSPAGDVPPIRRVGVVGAGTMGAGIAQLAALKGCDVVVREVTDAALKAGLEKVRALFNKAVERGLVAGDQGARTFAAVHGTTGWDGFGDVDLVVEAVIEDLDLKRAVFRDMEQHVPPSAILATNTSSLGVKPILGDLQYPERVAGLHFFNPVHKMPLVEVVRGDTSAEPIVDALVRWAIALGKTPVVVKDSPGFVVNRILMPYLNEAVLLVGEGMDVARVDQAMRRFGMPMGPLELIDQIGIDVGAHIGAGMEAVFGDRLVPNPVFGRMKEKGWLGQKANLGFYCYQGRKKTVHAEAVALVRGVLPPPSPSWLDGLAPKDQIQTARERMVGLMVNEAAACLGEHLADSAATMDLAMVLGTGWAPHRGGPLRYGQDVGYGKVVTMLEELAQRFGPRFEPCAELRRLAGRG
jgi:3-hydroxyacyl-CoA dehydrogenase/enoyl-CoA hydratase/3-hydroxybutyryl-CoA epimerase